ncbi:MAG: redox-sensing transcriptional repressor Rex, partial [Verrucomicrobiota bacterium]
RFQGVILVGVGNLGSALLRYGGFQKEGFEITAAFDLDPAQANLRNVPFEIRHVDEVRDYVAAHSAKMAILAVPEQSAQLVANQLVDAGIQAILNFSPVVLQVSDEVVVNSVDLALELENLSYFIR